MRASAAMPADWDPETTPKVVPTPKARARILRDLRDVLEEPLDGIW